MLRTLALIALLAASPALAFDDPFEPNDDCATAWPLAMGIYSGLEASTPAPDFFTVTVDPWHTFSVHLSGSFNLNFRTDCGSEDLECQNGWTNLSANPVDVTVRVAPYFVSGPELYTLTLSQAIDPCLSQLDDPLEPNDSCTQALLLGPGAVSGLQVREHDPDFFIVSIPPGQIANIRADHTEASSPLRLRYPQPQCDGLNYYKWGNSYPGYELLSWKNLSGATEDLVLEVTTLSTCCTFYDLDVSFEPDPCLSLVPDAFEPNDTNQTSPLIQPGSYPGLNSDIGDEDYFRVWVPPATTVYAMARFEVEHANLSMYMWVTTNVGPVDQSFNSGDNEQVEWTNNTPTIKEVLFLVFPTSAFSNPATCAEYDLIVSFESGPFVGTNFCTPNPNSTGNPSAQVGTGSSSVQANDFGLRTIRVPAHTPGSVVYGPATDVLPIQGHNLCVGSPFQRSPVEFSGSQAVLEWSFDNQNEDVIAMGVTVYFQTWFRDPSQIPTFNFSNTTAVIFTE